MKTAFRIASAALALAAIISMPFSQPAQAAGHPDVNVEPSNPAYQVFGNVFLSGPNGVDQNAYARAYFRIQNIGGGTTGNILVAPTCTYETNHQTKNYAAKPAYSISSLSSGASTLIWFDCPRHANMEGMPVSASVKVRGNNEPVEQLKNNEASVKFQYIH
jgi:hypothetical protein